MKRILVVCFLSAGLALVWLFNRAALWMDYLLFPGFAKLTLKPPVFITGMPRSATTLCFNILNYDNRQFSSMKLWEILFAPSITQKKLALLIKKAGQKHCSRLYRSLSKIDRYLFKNVEDTHPISLFNPEEDDYLFLHRFSTLSFSFLFPRSKKFRSLEKFDTEVPEAKRKSLMKFYQRCIQRHLYVFGPDKTYLAKSPSHASKIKSLDNTFPGCRFIYLLRDPFWSISSTISLFRHFTRIFGSAVDIQDITRHTLALADHWYAYPLSVSREWPENRFAVVLFNEIIARPASAMVKTYTALGLPLSPDFEDVILQNKEEIESHRNRHTYSPGDLGITDELIRGRFGYLYDRYPDLVSSSRLENITVTA